MDFDPLPPILNRLRKRITDSWYDPLDAIVRFWTIVTWSFVQASFEVNFCLIYKTNTPLEKYCNNLNDDSLCAKSNKKWLRDGRSKLGDASASQSIGRDAGDAGQCLSCSMAIITRSDFNCVHEMSLNSLAIESKKNGFHSFNRDQERPAFVLKSSTNTCPHSKCQYFAIWHAFATQFSRQAPPWKERSIFQFVC